MDNPIIQALRRAKQAYMTNVGEPTAQLVGGGVRGYLGLDAPEYADSRGMEAYRNAAAISNTPVVGMPSMAVRAGAKAAPAIAQSLREHAKGFQEYNRALGPAGASQMVVWHGSPHKFDAFDSSKIGTGEGAQAYGHGLYLAEARDVAKSYADELGQLEILHNGRRVGVFDKDPAANAAHQIRATGGDIEKAIKRAQNLYTGSWKDSVINEIRRLGPGDVSESVAGNLYKVDLPDEKIARMLDWDKPLSQQGEVVREALAKLGYKYDAKAASAHDDALLAALTSESSAAIPRMPRNPMGSEIARGKGIFDQPQDKVIAEKLRQAGIPGIRYLDQGSRNISQQVQTAIDGLEYWKKVGDTAKIAQAERVLANAKKMNGYGTSNFVVFPGEEAALTILERNNEIINALRKKKQQ